MGLIILIIWAGALGVMGLPALALGAWIAVKSPRDRWFWTASGLAALASVVGQYVAVLSPFVRRGMVDWDLVMNAMFGWHLLVAAVAAGLVWLAGRWLRGSGINGVAAGLFVSVPLVIALALPVMFTVPGLLHLKFEP
jgi:hypothetical protein